MAGIISQETKNSVISSVDIVSVGGEYVNLEQRGNQWWGCCPFHNEKTASFSVTPDKHMYYCFGCHAGGDIIKFVMEMEKFKYPEAIEFLARKAGIEIVYTSGGYNPQDNQTENRKTEYINLYNRVADMFHYGLINTENGKFALNYITGRGISMETIEKFKIGYSPENRRWLRGFLKSKNFSDGFLNDSGLFSKKYPDAAFFSDRLMFPIFDRRGQVVAFGGRFLRGNSENSPKYLNSSGDLIQYQKRETLYAFNFAQQSIRNSKSVIICEGYMDCIAYHQCGISNAVATCGTALTEEHINMLKGFAQKEFLLSFDSDGAGQDATKKAILMIRKQGGTVKVIRLHGGKDPAEIMVNYGAETLTNEVNNAILDSDYLLESLSQKYQIDTPEGKTRAALEFFPYIDALQNDIQKESCLDLLGQKFNISPEAVRRDFHNRAQTERRVITASVETKQNAASSAIPVKVDSEMRAVLAVVSDTDQFKLMDSQLNEEDFENPGARYLFSVLKECSQSGDLSFNEVLNRCTDQNIQKLVASSVASGEFSKNNAESVSSGVDFLKRRSLARKRDSIIAQMRRLPANPVTVEDQELLTRLVAEKMSIDDLLKN
ncbi:MAG: DNA primase [Treponema sp.]|nr:DNA primase [Candidatus Treponema equifaecale]